MAFENKSIRIYNYDYLLTRQQLFLFVQICSPRRRRTAPRTNYYPNNTVLTQPNV